jgi:YegS/Rv2252/BmrU family lipid kinase
MFIIVNPVSGNGKTGQRWAGIEERLRIEGARFEVEFTHEPGHATALARDAAAAGHKTIVSVGGDGTLNEVVNGLIVDGRADPDVRLGLIPGGTGSDLGRGLGMPRDPLEAALRLLKAEPRWLDVGQITCKLGAGTNTRYFINVAGIGFDGAVSDRVNRSSKALGGTIPYLTSLLVTLFSYTNKRVHWTLDGQARDEVLNSVIVANARYFGGGMRISPNSKMDDGQFHVITLGDWGTVEFLVAVPRVYNGTHLTHPKVKEYIGREVTVEADGRMFLQAEGDLFGEAPAAFKVLPRALQVLV